MRKGILLLILFFSLLPLSSGRAQDPLKLNSLQIQIWPEYDKPSVLVIYQLTLPANTTFPAAVSVRIPAAAGDPNAVAARQVDGTLYSMDFTRQVSGEWASISFTTTAAEIQVEYYDPALTRQANARHYLYLWPGDYAVNQLTIQVQQPFDATQMRISPSLGSGSLGSDNLTYYSQDIGAISAGQDFRITVDYQKPSDQLSAENLPVQPSAPIPQSSLLDLNFSTWLPWIVGILGAGLIVGGIVWFWQSGRQRPAPQNRRRRARTTSIEAGSSAPEAVVYCSQCGKRASPGDLFCRSCGAAIRPR